MSYTAKCLLLFSLMLLGVQMSSADIRVGIVDQSIVSQDYWIAQWKNEWQSDKIAGLFNAVGVKVDIIGADILLNPSVLANYTAIFIPTDECYPDKGAMDGPISKNITNYIRQGGIYIMPMGSSHCRWRDILTGAVEISNGPRGEDFLGLMWETWGEQIGAGSELVLTAEGIRAGIPAPSFNRPMVSHCRGVRQAAIVYTANKENERVLYAMGIGKGTVIHYAGGLPLDAQLRDWLIGAYAAILRSGGPDTITLNREKLLAMNSYAVYPISVRSTKGNESCQMSLDGIWEIAEAANDFADDLSALPSLKWTNIRLPDSMHGALYRAGQIENPWYGDNWKKLQWVSDRDWCLRRDFLIPANWREKHIRLRFDGVNYKCALWIDGNYQGVHDGLSGGPTINISNLEKGKSHQLIVRLMRETDRDMSFKSAAMGGNDMWANKYRTMGIYQPVRLIATGRAYLEAPYVQTQEIAAGSATLWAQTIITNTSPSTFKGVIDATIIDLSTGKTVWKKSYRQSVAKGTSYWEQRIAVQSPRLWWPNGMGKQSLYRLELSLRDNGNVLDNINTRFGIRTLELIRNPYLPDKPRSNPGVPDYLAANAKYTSADAGWNRPDLGSLNQPIEDDALHNSDESYKFLFVVNGQPVYGKGACWLTSDDTLSISPQREGWMIKAAKNAGINLFRLNGGNCIFETEGFFNACDENGILIWQDLPMFCWSRGTRVPMLTWREQMKQSVLRLRQHASLAVYVGGNEFAPHLEALDPYLGVAREIIASYDNRPFRMGSPCGGTYHAYYNPSGSFEDLWNGDPNWYVKYFDESVNFVSEWSYVSYANLSLLKRIAPPEEINNPEPVGFDSLAFLKNRPTIYARMIEADRLRELIHAKSSYYGNLEQTSLAQFIEYSQMVQGETYGYVSEHWRSQFPYKGGETLWTYNSHGPSSSWSIIDWFGQPQVGYYNVKRSNEAVHVMANTNFFSWGPGDKFTASVFALNDGFKALNNTKVTARILDKDFNEVVCKSWRLAIPPLSRKSITKEVGWQIPSTTPNSFFFLELTLVDENGKRLSRQSYNLMVLSSLADTEARKVWKSGSVKYSLTKTGPWLQPQIHKAQTDIECNLVSVKNRGSEADVTLRITNIGSKPAFPVKIGLSRDEYSSVWSDNYFWLRPGESVNITGDIRLDMTGIDTVKNTPVVKVSDLNVEISSWNATGKSLRLL